MTHHEPKFGTDGVRGLANYELTTAVALKLGVAAAHVLGRFASNRHVIVGRDTRISGEMLEAALNAGMASMGAHVTNVGIVPTPAVARIALRTKATAGAVISASHNPYEDNGIKFFGSNAAKLSDDVEDEIESAMEEWLDLPRPHGADIGRIIDDHVPVDDYVRDVERSAGKTRLDGLKLAIDCANGATYQIAPTLFSDLGADVTVIHAEPDGININANCGSTHLEDLIETVKRIGAHAGLAFDGDGDRVMVIDEFGNVIDGDKMMTILAAAMQRNGTLRNNVVVGTIMSNAGLDVALEKMGAHLVRASVGDRYVAEAMLNSGAALGGEQSGHILLPALTPTGDGMLTGLQILCEMKESGKALSDLASAMIPCPQKLRNVRVKDRIGWKQSAEIAAAIEQARNSLTKPEWLSVRASGTEPLIRVMAQDTDADRVYRVVGALCDLLEARFGASAD